MKQKHIFVTGGAGLVGRHLVPILVSKGYKVTALDQFQYKFDSADFIQGDFSDTSIVAPILKESDIVVHLAAVIGVDNCRDNPEKVIEINNINTQKFFDACVNAGVKKIVFSSSSEVYGDSTDVPFREDGKLSPYSVYGKNKVLMEEYLQKLHQRSGIQVGIVRLFNVYGPGQKETFVVPIFIKNCLADKAIIIHGDGKQVRCFTYVEDAAQGIFQMCEYSGSGFEIINIGRNYEYTMMNLAKAVKQALPTSKSEIVFAPYGQNGVRSSGMEVMRRVPSTEKAKKLLGFEATTSLEDGINKIILHGNL